MDSLGNDFRVAGFMANLAINGRTVVLTANRGTFDALVSSQQMIDPSMPIIADPRESIAISALRSTLPSALTDKAAPSQIDCTVDGVALKLTKRDDNPANPFVAFDAVRVV
jgi:hypothetical protein